MLARRIGERGSRVAIAAAILALLLLAKALPAWEALSGSAFDILSTIGQPVPEEPVAIIVAIDEPIFSAIGQPNWTVV